MGRKLLRPEEVTLYDLNKHFILPLTEEFRCSYAELVADSPCVPQFFCSHWWGSPVFEFIVCLEQLAMDRYGKKRYEDTLYWICAYANNQWDLSKDVQSRLSGSSRRGVAQLLWCFRHHNRKCPGFGGRGQTTDIKLYLWKRRRWRATKSTRIFPKDEWAVAQHFRYAALLRGDDMQKHTQALSSYPGLAFRVDLNVPQFRGEVYNFLNLALPATLESLDLTYSHPRLVASSDEFARGLGRFQALKSLKFQLRFPVKEAVNFSTETFFLELRELTGLEELDLFFDNIDLSGEFAHGLSKLARLKSFRFILQRSKVLRQGPCSDKTLLQELAECTALETLDLSFGHGGLILDESFSATADKLVNLSYLRLGMEVGLHPKEFTGVLADALQQYPRLRHLSISGLCSLTCLRPLLFKRDSCLEALEVSMSGLEVTRDGTIAARLHATEAAPVVSLSGFESCGNNCNLHEFHLSLHNVEQLAIIELLRLLGSSGC
ncbi:expressed unknown protein [Seminavis robusta]|uniref:Uncharacterized protein n=1 Tax=Seminavis robusta TaxID=568900 RepID=A0A9N8E2C8_9STRA|nr:expressed unknown protein [Seminavis robusta]|eukprot:Sro548_g164440.1 n/a (491) ;mRNA; r:38054-39961